MGSLNPLDHTPYLPSSWRSVEEFLRKTVNTVNSILNGNPVPARWDDYLGNISAGKAVGANAPTWKTHRDGINAYAFEPTTKINEVWINIHISHTYKIGTKIFPHIHWSPGASTDTGTVRWGVECSISKGHGQEAFPASTTQHLEQVADGTAYKHYIAEVSTAQAFDGLEPDAILMIRFFRDAPHANDTFADDAFGFFVDVHFQEDRMIGTPFRAPDFYESPGA